MDEKKNRQSWLEAGLDTLASEGSEGLRIMSIATKLGVTKGSFYWHFNNLDDYHEALLQLWEQVHTQRVMDKVERGEADVSTRLRALFTSLPRDQPGAPGSVRLGRAIRAWSMTSLRVREVLDRVDKRRIDYVAAMLAEAGWPDSEAQFLARWCYSALIGQAALDAAPAEANQIDTLMSLLIRS